MDIDWGDPAAQADALARLLDEVDCLEQWVTSQVPVAEAPPGPLAELLFDRG